MAHEYIDKHGNVWREGNGPDRAYEMIHAESEESRKAAWAEIKQFAAERRAAHEAINELFGLAG